MTALPPIRFGQTTWTWTGEKSKPIWRDNPNFPDNRHFHGFAKIDQADFKQQFPFGVMPKLNQQHELLKPEDKIQLAISMSQRGDEFPSSLNEVEQYGLFSIDFHYPEHGIPKDVTGLDAMNYASGYEGQYIDSQEKALGFFNYLDNASLPEGEATVDAAKEAMFLDVLMRAAYDHRGHMEKADADRLVKRWSSEIGRGAKNVKLPKSHPVSVLSWFVPDALGKQSLLAKATQKYKKALQKEVFTELIQLALPPTSAPHRSIFRHYTNPVPGESKKEPVTV